MARRRCPLRGVAVTVELSSYSEVIVPEEFSLADHTVTLEFLGRVFSRLSPR
jgi:hypothetical protein